MSARMSGTQILEIYREAGAIWFFDYDGDPRAPHAELISGRCSDGYVNASPVLCQTNIVRGLAEQMVSVLTDAGLLVRPDWVVGSAYAAITLSYEVARWYGARHGFVEKDPSDPKGKKMLRSRFVIQEDERVLRCEDLITTRGTTEEVRRAVTEGNPYRVRFLDEVATVIYRPERLDGPESDGIVALASREVKSWAPEECPLCMQGSRRVRPKSHWAELTGEKRAA